MTLNNKTLRLIFPDWQNGASSSSGFVPRLLATIAPQCDQSESVEVPLPESMLGHHSTDLMSAQASNLLTEMDFRGFYTATRRILDEKKPARVITFSTDGTVTLCSTDYLHEQYQDLGLLWLDLHQEHITPERFWRKRVIVTNALTGGCEELSGLIHKPMDRERILYVCRQADEIPPGDRREFQHQGISMAGSEALEADSRKIADWIRSLGLRHLSVHVDLDSVGAADLRSGILREENLRNISEEVQSDVDKLKVLFKEILKETDIVGFDLMEYELFQSEKFTELMKELPIFKE
ncbi:hypothetical protein MAF45_05855 [Mesosutterella sp. OilRF-GAM-744-9]|uniref:Arginase n=1 Tax=Mesosutterella porci TaxID=2915351 RepID=A0ABS9MQR3_9BURK|nr:hypothetical protein [Mesosutterella sp. oilRF-744-WT-GAM-9]MCG5030970.1 hypothetical protein [Mesosutterella sp. oilRF-744-WT-GAM-9]